jgi:hypothetical protein
MKTRSPATIDLVPAIDPGGNLVYTTWDQAVLLYFGDKLVSFLAGVPWRFVLGSAGVLVLLGLLGLPRPPRRLSRRK